MQIAAFRKSDGSLIESQDRVMLIPPWDQPETQRIEDQRQILTITANAKAAGIDDDNIDCRLITDEELHAALNAASATPSNVDKEIARRITAIDSINDAHKRMLLGEKTPDAILKRAASIRAAGKKLKAMAKIPGDFRDDRHWS